MPTLNVTDAATRLLANKTVTPGHCLLYVSRAIRNGQQPLIWSGLDTALNSWNLACGDKHTSRDVPKGFPAFLGAKPSSAAGDVIISLGGGKFAATDWPGWGTVGTCTLEQREAQTGRKYLGYAGEFLGYTLAGTATASLDVTPITEEEDDDMDTLKPKLIKRTEGTEEWSLCAPWLAKPGDKLQQGYIVTADKDVATAWARLYDRGFGNETATDRNGYVAMQAQAREIRKQWLAAQPAAAAASGPTAAQIAVAVNDDAAARLAK